MTIAEKTNAAEAPANDKPAEHYSVGYSRPPKAFQFKKGVSGNPKGRPKKSTDTNYECLYEENVKRLAYKAAYEKVPVREGDKTVYMPAIEALLRMMLRRALKGDRGMLRDYFRYVAKIESDRRSEKIETMTTAFEYKENARKAREQAKKENRPAPEFVFDPDNIEIDTVTGSVTSKGPLTREQKQELDELRKLKADAETAIREIAVDLEETPDDQLLLDDKAHAEKIVKMLTEAGL